MLTAEGCRGRQARLWEAVGDDVEWLLIADPRHVNYLCGFWVNPISFATCERGLLLLERGGKSTLLADNFAVRSASAEIHADEVVNQSWYTHKKSVINRDHALIEAMLSLGNPVQGKRGLVEAEWLPVMAFGLTGGDPWTAGAALGSTIRHLRRQKDADELELMSACMRATDAGHAAAREFVKPGVSEFDIYRCVQEAAVAAAGRPAVVYGDFRAVNAELPKAGGQPTDYVLKDGDLFILDYSIVLDGYRSDFTNTLAADSITDDQQRVFDTCKAAMAAAESVAKAGTEAKAVYEAASGVMTEAGFDPLAHHAGHGLGLGHPEAPILVSESEDVLLAGDVITLEPGMYVPGIGGVRIENNYLVEDGGLKCLSNHEIAL